jgi:tetrahydromethanopterin S-methyltransferase subunit F
MSGLPSGISVFRHIPQHLVQGFTSGEFRLWGGVLRRATNPGQGQIVGFLTEGWELTRQIEQNLPINVEALKAVVEDARMASQLAAGIGVLNLGVQVAGFAMVMHRLERISGQIEVVRSELRAVGQNVEWLAMAQLADLRALAANAIATAASAFRQRDRVLLNQARTLCDRARRYLINLCDEMLAAGRAVPQRALFEEFVKFGALIAYAEARCQEMVEGAGQASYDLAITAARLRRVSNGFDGQVREFERNPLNLIRIGDAGRATTKALAHRMNDAVTRLESYVPQLKLQHALRIDAADWQALVAPEGSGPLTCITFEGEMQGDLVEFTQARMAA